MAATVVEQKQIANLEARSPQGGINAHRDR
jgi:hypothetical protein